MDAGCLDAVESPGRIARKGDGMSRPTFGFTLAGLTMALAALTAAVPDWIEAVFGLDPDAGSGATEWIVVGVLATASLLLAAYAIHIRRPMT
jgi:hypothetical protein